MSDSTASSQDAPRRAPDSQKNEILGTSQSTTVELIDADSRYVKFTLSHDGIIDLVSELLGHPNIAEHFEP